MRFDKFQRAMPDEDIDNIDVACVGMLSPAEVYVVDNMPDQNGGSAWKSRHDFLSEDAAIVATTLKHYGFNVAMVCNELGDDVTGHNVMLEFNKLRIKNFLKHNSMISTPYEVVFSDSHGRRQYVWNRDISVLSTLATANTELIKKSEVVYADWYDWPYNAPALQSASENNSLVFLNLEDKYSDEALIDEIIGVSSIIQIAQERDSTIKETEVIARHLLHRGIAVVLVTNEDKACRYITKDRSYSIIPPTIKMVDANGAGAVFSAAFISGIVNKWDVKKTFAMAVSAASLKCQIAGPSKLGLDEIKETAQNLLCIEL